MCQQRTRENSGVVMLGSVGSVRGVKVNSQFRKCHGMPTQKPAWLLLACKMETRPLRCVFEALLIIATAWTPG